MGQPILCIIGVNLNILMYLKNKINSIFVIFMPLRAFFAKLWPDPVPMPQAMIIEISPVPERADCMGNKGGNTTQVCVGWSDGKLWAR